MMEPEDLQLSDLVRPMLRLLEASVSQGETLRSLEATQRDHTVQLKDIREVQAEHTRRLDGIDNRLDGIDNRLDGIDARLDRMDGRMDLFNDRLAESLLILQEIRDQTVPQRPKKK